MLDFLLLFICFGFIVYVCNLIVDSICRRRTMVRVDGNYVIKNCSIEYLASHGFRYKIPIDKDEPERYTYKFPVYKYRNKTNIIFCTIFTDIDGNVSLKITQQDGSLYQPYYNIEYGNYTDILNKIDVVIMREFKKLGIVEVE